MKNSLIILLAFTLTSCEDFFMRRLDNPEIEKQIYSVCVLEPGMKQLSVPVYWTTPLFGPEVETRGFNAIHNANVVLKGNGFSYSLIYNANKMHYESAIDSGFIVVGQTYTIDISADGKTSNGTTTVPSFTASDVKMRYEISKLGIDDEETLVFFSEFKDGNGEGDYYLTTGGYSINAFDPQANSPISFDPVLHTQSDKDRDGQILEQVGKSYYFTQFDYLKAELSIECLSRDLFFHNQAMNSYASYYYDPENPFVEPTIAHDNMEGGIGVIGSRNLQTFEFVLK